MRHLIWSVASGLLCIGAWRLVRPSLKTRFRIITDQPFYMCFCRTESAAGGGPFRMGRVKILCGVLFILNFLAGCRTFGEDNFALYFSSLHEVKLLLAATGTSPR